jgi:hypothetical protein
MGVMLTCVSGHVNLTWTLTSKSVKNLNSNLKASNLNIKFDSQNKKLLLTKISLNLFVQLKVNWTLLNVKLTGNFILKNSLLVVFVALSRTVLLGLHQFLSILPNMNLPFYCHWNTLQNLIARLHHDDSSQVQIIVELCLGYITNSKSF